MSKREEFRGVPVRVETWLPLVCSAWEATYSRIHEEHVSRPAEPQKGF